ncbi:MAG: hypothetical protein LUG98_02810 [Tannerellaceae bacterium]|nr:hypothetical protein [Tannerellaceae bacterium]
MMQKSTFSILFFLRTDQPKKNGEVMIRVRITIDSKSVTLSTQLFIHPDDWNKVTGRAMSNRKRRNTDTVTRINNSLDNLKVKIQKVYDKYCDERGFALPEDIKNSILGKEEKKKSISYYCEEYLSLKAQKVGIGIGDKAFHR